MGQGSVERDPKDREPRARATRIKFCGLTRPEDVDLAVALGVDFIGLVFAARSPRRLDPVAGAALRARIPDRIATVALLMDASATEVGAVVETVRPDLLQFHGAEPDAFCAGFGLPFWKAIAMGGDPDRALAGLGSFPHAAAFLFDGHAAGEPGGGGQRFDWARLPDTLERPFLLAGGLDAGNVARAIATARPWGVDVSSGIEQSPGLKDAARMRAFVEAVRCADADGAPRS
ncbi:N-(5'-phosphoribosyl)anthranilate isomerase [Lysobacter maris]|uniref:N-(5'-phosphoribosyl)anthranilate isomerase n=1 Tax=Marilutibacter maris TaxID=1605891 RepID=A0A508B488_9GAMM|nr:phosphoribosylanthranilate isomerase [Lysobacter maris]KAB8196924.1 N-(5'-phosphoribosyl)anthranilate isomerase [Lysobacter maris]